MDAIWFNLLVSDSSLCVIATGGGKTAIFTELIQRCLQKKPDIKIVVLLNKIDLVKQTFARLTQYIDPFKFGVYCGTENSYELNQITIASIQSIHNIDIGKINLIILDETHNVSEKDGRYFNFIEKHKHDKLKIVGFTATPFRSDGVIYGENKLFKKITYKKTLDEMIEGGFLVMPHMKKVDQQFDISKLRVRMGEFRQDDVDKLTCDEKKIREQILDAIPRMIGRVKAVWACSSIAHAELVYYILKDLGEQASIIHSKMTNSFRNEAKDKFENQDTRHLVFVSIVSEGYDYAPIDCVVLMRPMRSPVLYVQTIGRGLRPSPNKEDLLVLDYGKVVETIGPLTNPKIPKKGERYKPAEISEMKFCPKCFEYVERSTTECPVCDHVFFKPKEITKNLTKVASQDLSLLFNSKPKTEWMNVESVKLIKFTSKNGNECLKVEYKTTDLLRKYVSEFFMWNHTIGHKKMIQRLIQLDCGLSSDLLTQSQQEIKKIPTRILVETDKFMKVVGVDFNARD